MDTLLVVFAFIAIITALAGSVLPFIPGPPLAWGGLLMIHFSSYAELTTRFLVITAIITVIIVALDYFLPVWTARRSGGTKYGQRGALWGMIIGIFMGPLGVIIGPLIGAFIGELVHDATNFDKATRAAWNSFVGFLLGTGIKFGWCLIILFWSVRALI